MSDLFLKPCSARGIQIMTKVWQHDCRRLKCRLFPWLILWVAYLSVPFCLFFRSISWISLTICFLVFYLTGIAADFTKNRLRQPRTYCVALVAALFIISQLACVGIDEVQGLWKASALLGLAYGGLFGLFPTMVIEYFGLRKFIYQVYFSSCIFFSSSPFLGKLGIHVTIPSLCRKHIFNRIWAQFRCPRLVSSSSSAAAERE